MKRRLLSAFAFASALAFLGAAGCSDDDNKTPTPPTCDPVCGSCQTCDTSGATPICVDNCAVGTTCQNEKCEAPAVVECSPACGSCQMCDTAGATPTCVDLCASGTSCENGKCVPPQVASCSPACGPCQQCDTTGASPKCVDVCANGLECKGGQCVAPGDACAGACASCERCETQYGLPICVDACQSGTSCDKTAKVCRPDVGGTAFDHGALTELAGPFAADNAGAKAVTAKCIGCHAKAADDMLKTAHWKWLGSTPNLEGHKTGATVGKLNLINNFCVAVPSNEQRCAQCHAGYGYKDNTFDFTDKGAIDCLVCHAKTNYARGATSMGPDFANTDLVLAAKSVGSPTRAACGRCHFGAGGGDNVKKGDMGSAMGTPTAAADVHMGAATNSFTCASCHKSSAHKVRGQGVHLPVSEGRLGCVECHGETPHGTNKMLDNHAKDVACQTCHVPAFSRQQPTKVNWDWSTAGNMSRGTAGVETQVVDGVTVPVYDAKKGDFIWKGSVRPSYAWYDGGTTRLTIKDAYTAGQGAETNPVVLGEPTSKITDLTAKIFPFKVMLGRQPVDPTKRLVLVPKLFGPGSFWATIPATYDATTVENNWTTALTVGARYSGQIAASESYTGRGTGANQWAWAYTKMYMGINHEVAPKAQALGCSSCHGAPKAEWDWTELGYSCDPQSNPSGCGSRHP